MLMPAMTMLVIFLGSGLGGVARWWCGGWITERIGPGFPWGTLMINIVGSVAIGAFAAACATPEGRWPAPLLLRQFFMIGICGGFTTFSSFSLQTLELCQQGQWLRAGVNVVLSVVLCLAGVWLGHTLASR